MAEPSTRSRKNTQAVAASDDKEAEKFVRRSSEELSRRGVPPHMLSYFVLKLMISLAARHQTDWDKPRVMTRHTLKRFPARILQLADKIEALNSDPVLGPSHVFLPCERPGRTGRDLKEEFRDTAALSRKALAHRLDELPVVMREYAEALRFVTSVIERSRRHPYDPLHHCLVAFVEAVHETTRVFMYPEIAALANAIIAMTGDEIDIDPANLRNLYRNNPHLRSGISFNLQAR